MIDSIILPGHDITVEHIFNSISIPLGIINEQQILIKYNSSFAAFYGSTRKEPEGMSIFEIVNQLKVPGSIVPDMTSKLSKTSGEITFDASVDNLRRMRVKMVIGPVWGGAENSKLKLCSIFKQGPEIRTKVGLSPDLMVNEMTCYRSAIENFRSLLSTQWWSPTALCRTVVPTIAALFKTPVAGLSLLKSGKPEYGARFQDGKVVQGEKLAVSVNLAHMICREHRLAIHYGELHKQFPSLFKNNSPGITSMIGVPLISNVGEMLGIVYVADMDGRFFDKTDMDIMEVLGWYVSVALERISSSAPQKSSFNDSTLLHSVFSGLAHEVRNPLNGISALSAALQREIGHSQFNKYFDLINEQTSRLSGLMQQLIVLGEPARLKRHSFESLVNVCNEVILRWPEKNEGATINARLLQVKNITADFLADTEHLKIAIVHLLQNSMQNSSGESEVIVDIGEAGDQLFIKIVDSGCGVDPAIYDRIFEPFFTSFKKKNGLGLSIAKKIIEGHRGTITLSNNRYSSGCTAEIRIPFLPDE